MTLAADIRYATGVENAWSTFMEAVPKVIVFLVILVVGFVVAKAIGKVVTTLLRKANFDAFVQRGAIKRAISSSTHDASQLVGKLAYYAAALFALVLAFGVFGGANPVSQMLAGIMAFLPKLVVAIVIVLLAAAIASWVKDIVTSALGGLSYGATLGTIASGAILVTGIFMALTQLEIAPAIVTGLFYAVLAAVVGVTVVAVGGGGIQPMRARWERALETVDAEGPKVKEHARQAKEARAARTQQVSPPHSQPFGARSYPADQAQPGVGSTAAVGATATPPAAYAAEPRMAQGQDSTMALTQDEMRGQEAPGGFAAPDGRTPPA